MKKIVMECVVEYAKRWEDYQPELHMDSPILLRPNHKKRVRILVTKTKHPEIYHEFTVAYKSGNDGKDVIVDVKMRVSNMMCKILEEHGNYNTMYLIENGLKQVYEILVIK